MAEELSEKFYRRNQPGQDDFMDRLRIRNMKAMECINEIVGQFGFSADQLSNGRIIIKKKENRMGLSFLKNIGQILTTGVSVANVLTQDLRPVIDQPIFQNVQDELPKIADAIAQVEAIGQLMQLGGPDKLKIAVPIVSQIVLKSPLMAGKQIVDQAAFQKAMTDLTNGMVGLLNSVQGG